MSSYLRATPLLELCAPSISYDRQVQAACQAIDNQLVEIIDDTPQVLIEALIARSLPHPPSITDTPLPPLPPSLEQDELLTDILAWQYHVDFYDKNRPLAFRKQLVANAIQWHMRKGTVALVEEVLNTYFPGVATLQEWYEYMNPLPPNYPIDNVDTQVATFGPSQVDVPGDRFLINAHGLTLNQQIKFRVGSLSVGGRLPAPLVPEIYYYVANPHTNDFQVSPSPWHSGPSGPGISGSIVNLTDAGIGSNNEIWRRGAGSWHDRYRFRVLIDSQFIDPDDQRTVLELINNYKPISRWMDGFVRAQAMECDIGWTGMLLRFIYRESEAPDYP